MALSVIDVFVLSKIHQLGLKAKGKRRG